MQPSLRHKWEALQAEAGDVGNLIKLFGAACRLAEQGDQGALQLSVGLLDCALVTHLQHRQRFTEFELEFEAQRRPVTGPDDPLRGFLRTLEAYRHIQFHMDHTICELAETYLSSMHIDVSSP